MGVRASPAARNAALMMKFTAKVTLNAESQKMKSPAWRVASGPRPKEDAMGSANTIKGTASTNPRAMPTARLVKVTRTASSVSFAPQARATRAVVPADTAIMTACRVKKI